MRIAPKSTALATASATLVAVSMVLAGCASAPPPAESPPADVAMPTASSVAGAVANLSAASGSLVSGRLTTRLLDNPARVQAVTARSKVSRLQAAFAAHLRDIARAYPAARHPRVIVVIDNAAWHRGAPVSQVLAEQPHLTLYRLPSYSPHLNVVERLWRVLRRRATHNRLFATMAALRRALRASLCYYQTVRHKVLSLIQAPKNVAQSAAA